MPAPPRGEASDSDGPRRRLRCYRQRRPTEGVRNGPRDRYKIKSEVLGPDPGDVREFEIINKTIRLTSEGYELEPDPRHAELVAKEIEVEGRKPMRTPSVKDHIQTGRRRKLEDKNEKDRGGRLPGGDDTATFVFSC